MCQQRVTATGFRPSLKPRLSCPVGTSKEENITLLPGSASETVTVSATGVIGNDQLSTVAQAGILGTLGRADMPYSVSSYTSQIILDQQAQSITDVLANETGIQDGNGRYTEDNYLTMRGFILDSGQSLVNGMPGLVDNRSPAIDNIERVEIFKGPSTFLNGANTSSTVGGVVNLVTKRAGDAPFLRFDGGYSSKKEFEGHLDASRRFLHKKALGLRVNVGGRFGNTPVDNQQDHVGDATLGADYRNERLVLSSDLSQQTRGMIASRDAITLSPGFAVPAAPRMTSNIFDSASTFIKHQTVSLTQGTYTFGEHADVFGGFGYARSSESYVGPGASTLLNANGDVEIYEMPYASTTHTRVGRLGSHINFNTGPLQHALTADADIIFVRGAYFYEGLDTYAPYESNIYRPIALKPLSPRIVPFKNVPDTNQNRNSSVAIADVASAFRGRLVVIGGLRLQDIRVAQLGTVERNTDNTPLFQQCTDSCVYDKGRLSPSIAALFHVGGAFSVYSNFMQDLQQAPSPPTQAVNATQIFAPVVGRQVEVGAKYDRQRISATVALYRILEPNGVLNPTTFVFGLSGQERSRGLEISVLGNVLPSLRLISGITFADARQLGTGDPTTEGKRVQGIPATQSTVGAEYSVPKLRSMVLSARVTASSTQSANTTQTQSLPAWARLDIGGRYTFETRMPVTFRVNVDNVTGANYFQSALLGLAYTGPRTLRLSGGIRF